MDSRQKPPILHHLKTIVMCRNRAVDDMPTVGKGHRLDELVTMAESSCPTSTGDRGNDESPKVKADPRDKTAILLVSGFNGMGLHTLFGIIRLFGGTFKNFVFIHIGITDPGSIRDPHIVALQKNEIRKELDRYIRYMQCHGYFATGYSTIGTDIVDEIAGLTPEILQRFPNAVLFHSAVILPKKSFLPDLFRIFTTFAIHRKFFSEGIPVVSLPVRV